jgi:hypothetical protein
LTRDTETSSIWRNITDQEKKYNMVIEKIWEIADLRDRIIEEKNMS